MLDQVADDDVIACERCRRREHIDLLDAKPNDPKNPDGCDWEVFECIRCYGPGWDTNLRRGEALRASVNPRLRHLYERYFLSGFFEAQIRRFRGYVPTLKRGA